MSEKEVKPNPLQNELIGVLKELQSKLKTYEGQTLEKFSKDMEPKLNGHLTDNPKFNEFIKKFTTDAKNMNSEDAQKISKKLMIAFLYINSEIN